LNKTGPQSIHILRGVRQQQDEPGRFSICSRQAAVVRQIQVEGLRRLREILQTQGLNIEALFRE
ncbi:hypothetical protein, partial [Salmonella enterica]|uniref:hypothetical protein n=1 Tax=Salmonella enterica TaxID=28901 RepID=UPI001C5507CF